MIDIIDNQAVVITYYVALFMAFLVLMVFSVALIGRWRINKIQEQSERIRETLGEKIISYVSGDLSLAAVHKELNTKRDYIVLLELVNNLEQSLEGVEEERLQELMEMEETRVHFQNRFSSEDAILQAKACLYMSRKKSVEPQLLPELVAMSASREPVLAYAATSVVIVHGSIDQKKEALSNVLQNREVSDMAIGDLFVKFTDYGEEYHIREMETITEFIANDQIKAERRAVLIRILDEMEYFHSVEFLEEFYRRGRGAGNAETETEVSGALNSETGKLPPVILKALIEVLTRFGVEEILPDLHEEYLHSKNPEIRLAATEALGFFRKEESIPFLKWLINDTDYRVRYKAVMALSRYPDVDLESIKPEQLNRQEWKSLVGEVMAQQEPGGA